MAAQPRFDTIKINKDEQNISLIEPKDINRSTDFTLYITRAKG